MKAEFGPEAEETRQVIRMAERFPDIHTELHVIRGSTRTLTEVYLLGPTSGISSEPFEEFAAVEKVIRIRERYRTIGRHEGQAEALGFEYNGIHFSQDSFHLFPGVCAVDTRQNLADTFAALRAAGVSTTRAGAYKPRTSPYDFQGHGAECLPWTFELAGKYGIRVIAMEVTSEAHIEEIRRRGRLGDATGVMLRSAPQRPNFELPRPSDSRRSCRCSSSAGWGSRWRSRSTPASTSPRLATAGFVSVCVA